MKNKKKFLSAVLVTALSGALLSSSAMAMGDMGKTGSANTISISPSSFYYESLGVVKEDGTLWMGKSFVPVPDALLENVASVSIGGYNAAVVKQDGSCWFWGYEADNGDESSPVKVLDNVSSVSMGLHDILAIQTNGTLVEGQYDYDENNKLNINFETLMDDVTAVSVGWNDYAAIQSDGSLWTWGNNVCGELGNGAVSNKSSDTPTKIMDNVIAVSVGSGAFDAAIQADHSLWTWGNNSDGQLGNGGSGNAVYEGTSDPIQTVPVKVLDDVIAVSAGSAHTAAIKTDGSLWTWGSNAYGQLGNGTTEDSAVPVKVMDGVAAVCAGDYCTLIVKTDGTLWICGYYTGGTLGSEDTSATETVADPYDEEGTIEIHTVPALVMSGVKLPSASGTVSVGTSTSATAYASNYSAQVDGKPVAFDAYALRDANGNDTNYLKLRDLAYVLNGSAAQFNVEYDSVNHVISVTAGVAYSNQNGSEMSTPFSGDQPYKNSSAMILVNGVKTDLSAITLTDANGGGYTYFKLRDLGKALGFDVDWDNAAKTILIDTTKPYSE